MLGVSAWRWAAATVVLDAIDDRVADLSLGQLLSRSLSGKPLRSAMADYMSVPTSGYDAPS
ncbi:hypothetical protein ACFVAV_01825 [Nocardia sp. NPDC057663]|uniref:hypothetical protein n=1 Tax=Nocardia sp. NPDC057663 TaxID=3346201 RepID=UPI00367353FD